MNGKPNDKINKQCDFISSILVSVKRDMLLCWIYAEGSKKNKNHDKDLYKTIFQDDVAKFIREQFKKEFGSNNLWMSLYAYKGDLLSQLARLLICSKDVVPEEYRTKGNEETLKIKFKKYSKETNDFIKAMRNSISHSNFEVIGEGNDVVYKFWNVNSKGNINFYVEMTPWNLQDFINIVFNMLKDYLKDNNYYVC